VQARITRQNAAFVVELFDERGRRAPDVPVITSSLDEAQALADRNAGISTGDPWMPVYHGTLNVALPDDSDHEKWARATPRDTSGDADA
jgi:hypothetical protein